MMFMDTTTTMVDETTTMVDETTTMEEKDTTFDGNDTPNSEVQLPATMATINTIEKEWQEDGVERHLLGGRASA